VRLAEQWIKTGVVLRRGNRLRVVASGTITLDGRTQTGPDGVNGRRDPDAPMPDENDGALIAIIGQEENAPEILIGRQRGAHRRTGWRALLHCQPLADPVIRASLPGRGLARPERDRVRK
jgi:hypothetical protein